MESKKQLKTARPGDDSEKPALARTGEVRRTDTEPSDGPNNKHNQYIDEPSERLAADDNGTIQRR